MYVHFIAAWIISKFKNYIPMSHFKIILHQKTQVNGSVILWDFFFVQKTPGKNEVAGKHSTIL